MSAKLNNSWRPRFLKILPGMALLMVAALLLVWGWVQATLHPTPGPSPVTPNSFYSSTSIDSPNITNDGQAATVVVDLRDKQNHPIAGERVRLVPSAAFMTSASGRTDRLGMVLLRTTVRSGARHMAPSAGPLRLTVVDETHHIPIPHALTLTVYNRVAVLLQGVGTSLHCRDRACLEPMFMPLVSGVLKPLGYRTAIAAPAILEYSYQGGAMINDGGAWTWKPRSYDACDTLQSVSHSAQVLRDMLVAYRARYPYSTFELVGHSLGGLVAMQAIGYHFLWQQIGPLGVDKLVTIDSPVNGITDVHALSWLVDGLAGIWHLHDCPAQGFGLDLVGELSGLGDQAPARQHAWAAVAKAHGAAILTVTNRDDLLVPEAYALLDADSPASVVDRIRLSVAPLQSLGHSSLLYPVQAGGVANLSWPGFAATLRMYLRQPCLVFSPRDAKCPYPSINRGF
ncbi:MAG: hypothetical protein JWO42_2974 [Chloroflexi bacterium]|nr:hypothetical protein [Chloroflexota bacterium]